MPNLPPIPPEAESAWVAYRDTETRSRDRRALRKRDFLAGFAAALPFLPQHVSPSVEQIVSAVSDTRSEDERLNAVLALFSSAPTVEQVRRETLAFMTAGHEPVDSSDNPATNRPYCDADGQSWPCGLIVRARAAEAVDPRGE